MYKYFFKFSLFLIGCIGFSQVKSQVILPSVFSDHMVLQRNADVKIWGWGGRGSEVWILPGWSQDTVKVTCDGYARWSTTLKTPEAGGPYEIKFVNRRITSSLKDVLIGEVWLVSGQSNMEWGAQNKLQEMLDEISKANNDNIRLLHVNRIASDTPQDNFINKWEKATDERLAEFSAIGYFLAQRLNKELDVPIGIISANWGGTIAEVWMPDTVVTDDPILAADVKTYKVAPSKPTIPGALWNSMIHPLAGYKIAGFLWYQGESNVGKYQNYNTLMTKLVQSWRNAWREELPFYYVQIAPYDYKSKPEMQRGALLREQQAELLTLHKTGMVVVSDLTNDVKNIHPIYKREVANRLANIALAEVYGKNLQDYKSPVYKSHTIKGGQVIVEFDHVNNGLMIKGNKVTELFIAGEDGIIKEANAKIEGNKLIVSHPAVKNPKSVLFSFSDTAISNLFSKSGLPVAPFRIESNPEESLGWHLGAQAYTFNRFTFTEALDKIESCGLRYVEAYPQQKIGGGIEEKMDYKMSESSKKYIRELLKKKNITLLAYGVINTKDVSEWEKIFAFAKSMGIKTITCEPEENMLDEVSRLCEKYNIQAAIHNHPIPSHYWNPDVVLKSLVGRSKKMGAAADIGHWVRSGLDPVECLQKLEGKVYHLHFKDLNEKGNRKAHDVHWGTGVNNVPGVLAELKRQGFKGMISAEYEYNWQNNAPDVKQSVKNFREIVKSMK